VLYGEVGGRIRRWLAEGTHPRTGPLGASFGAGIVLVLFAVGSLAVQPAITGVTIPDVSMKINDVVTATIFVQSDSATVYTLNASNIGGHALGSLSMQDSTTYTAKFTVAEGGTDHAAAADIPISVTLTDGTDTNTWTTAISQTNDPIDANRPLEPVAADLASSSDNGASNSDDITNDDTATLEGIAGNVEGNATVTVTSSVDGHLGTTPANADGSWSHTVPSLSDGTHLITITAIDAAGNESIESSSLSVLIDTQDPETPGDRSPTGNARTNDISPTFSWTEPSDPGGSGIRNYRIQIDGQLERDYYTNNLAYTPSLAAGTFAWRIYARDVAGNSASWSAEWDLVIDPDPPSVTQVVLSDNHITDADVGGTFTVTVNYSEPMLSGTLPSIVFSLNLDTTLSFQAGSSDWNDDDTYVASYTILDGNVTVLDDDITVSAAQDLAGNVQEPYGYDDQLDVDTESPYIHDFTVTGGEVDDNCLRVVIFTAEVTDPNGTMVPGDITATDANVTNATIGAVYDILQTSDSQTTLTITGKVDVTALTGSLARVTITLDAVDSVNNAAAQQSQSDGVVGTTNPVINDVVVDDHVLVSADCCETTVNFTANVIDNCCITPGGITITPTNPTNNLTIDFDQARDVTITQNGEGRVDISGIVPVRCVTGSPAIVQVTVNATDCCGNDAVPVTSIATEGRVYDETAPKPKDDPNGDEDRSTSDNLEVRWDDYGQHRLMAREDTPVRIDVVYNDSDNCSCIDHDPCAACSGCDGTLRIFDIVDPPKCGTVTREDDERSSRGDSTSIRYAPHHGYIGLDEFTYRIEDSCGNVSQEATVYIEVVAHTVMDDIYLTTCCGAALSFDVKATDLWWVDPDNPNAIPFVFGIITPPMHGVISGDLSDVTYAAAHGTTEEIESAAITIIYTPAAGFVGRDAMILRVADPFAGSSTAVVDIAVIECMGQPRTPPPFVLQQGDTVPLIVPLTFASIYETAWDMVTLIAETDGTAYQGTLSATWEKSINRYVLGLDTASLPPGLYRMTIPLGNGETVTLMIEVSEAI